MYTIKLIGTNIVQEHEVNTHLFEERDNGYTVTDHLSINIEQDIIITRFELHKDNVLVGLRVPRQNIRANTDDVLSIHWQFDYVDTRKNRSD